MGQQSSCEGRDECCRRAEASLVSAAQGHWKFCEPAPSSRTFRVRVRVVIVISKDDEPSRCHAVTWVLTLDVFDVCECIAEGCLNKQVWSHICATGNASVQV